MLIKDLPEDIKKIAIQRILKHRKIHKDDNFTISIEESTIYNGFDWCNTIEYNTNPYIWLHVEEGNFESFYEFHKINNKNKLLNFNFY